MALTDPPAASARDDDAPRRLELTDGRVLAWQSFGDPAGRPLHVLHGFPSSRLLAALLDEPARAAGVCLVAADRPGFGRSSPAPRRTILDGARDVAALADHLGHERFGVLGISCGGAYALARVHPWLASPMLLADALLFRSNPEKAVHTLAGLLAPPDRRALEDDAVRGRFLRSFVEAYRQGIGGAMTEAALIARPRGFALGDIRIPVHVYQGGLDRHVPPAMGRHIAQEVPRGRLRYYAGEGHLSIVVNRFADCLDDFKETER